MNYKSDDIYKYAILKKKGKEASMKGQIEKTLLNEHTIDTLRLMIVECLLMVDYDFVVKLTTCSVSLFILSNHTSKRDQTKSIHTFILESLIGCTVL